MPGFRRKVFDVPVPTFGWAQVVVVGPAVHILPVGDDMQHIASPSCRCSPAIADDDDKDYVTQYLHHAADGREAFEDGERQPS